MRIWSHILMQLELMQRIQRSRTYERYQTRGDEPSRLLAEVAE